MLNFENLDKHIQKLADEQAFPGGVLCVYHHGKMVKETAYGTFNPETGEKIYVARSMKDKEAQRRFFFWYKPEERKQIAQLLRRMGRNDLVKKLGI
jgi:hypothetical protein